jgi:hypothetical protein
LNGEDRVQLLRGEVGGHRRRRTPASNSGRSGRRVTPSGEEPNHDEGAENGSAGALPDRYDGLRRVGVRTRPGSGVGGRC